MSEFDCQALAANDAPRPRLLIVDDIANNREMLARRFNLRNFDTAEADSGQKALTLIEEEAFDAVLLDIVMPDLDGLEVLSRIRRRYSAAELPVIMVTGLAQSSDIVKALSLGANDYVTKPVDFAVARARVCTQLARKRAEERLNQLLTDLQASKALVEAAIKIHVDQLKSDAEALSRTHLDQAQRAAVESLQASGIELARAIALSWAASLKTAA